MILRKKMNRACSVALAAVALLVAGCKPTTDSPWIERFAEAEKMAQQQGRKMLVLFITDDLDEPCRILREKVLETPEFLNLVAEKQLLLAAVRFPKELGNMSFDDLVANSKVSQRYRVSNYPMLYVTDAVGRPFAFLGGATEDADLYINKLKEILGKQEKFDRAMAEAVALSGEQRALALAAVLEQLPTPIRVFYADVVQDIVRNDPQDKTGYVAQEAEKNRIREQVRKYNEFQLHLQGKTKVEDLVFARAEALSMLAQEKWEPTLHLLLCKFVSASYAAEKNLPKAIEYMKAAIAADPESDMAKQLHPVLEAMEKRAAQPEAPAE